MTNATTPVEVAWFGALCDDDYEFLGVPDPALRSSWHHCSDLVRRADELAYDNVLLPSGYALGIDSVAFAGGIAQTLNQIRLLVAVRCGELWPPQLARQLATLDQMLRGRLTINIISSDRPGETLESAPRYRRTLEVMQILRTLLNGLPVTHHGEFYTLELDPPAQRTASGRCPLLYFGGQSAAARDVGAQAGDVYLLWPDTIPNVAGVISDLTNRARAYGRSLRFGYRVHVIVRETEADARQAARRLVSRLDDATGSDIRGRSLDAGSVGVHQQSALRARAADDGFVEENLWTGIGRARSGCGAAIVGDPDQVLAKIAAYRALGIESFILSGYPHRAEAEHFARLVLPHLHHGALPCAD